MNVGNWEEAIESGDVARIQSLIDNHSSDINKCFGPERLCASPLLYAVRLNQLQIADLLLRNNADINQKDEFGFTACHKAISLGVDATKALALLLTYKPDLSLANVRGTTALSLAFSRANSLGIDISIMLIEAGAPIAGIDNLSFFASKGTAAIQLLIKRGFTVGDLVDYNGATPLHHACNFNEFDLPFFNMLLDCGVDLETRDVHGLTCIFAAVNSKNNKTLCWLIENGAELSNACGPSGGSKFTLMHAVRDYNCAISLLAAGASIHGVNYYGRTPAHMAIMHNEKYILYALLAVDANLDVADSYGVTARQELSTRNFIIDDKQVDQARRDITKKRLDFVRFRALQVCIGLQSLSLPALLTCEILYFACGPVAPIIPFHHWWQIATTVKHF